MGEEALEVTMNEAESNRWKPLPEAWVEVMARASAQCERVMKILGDLGRSWEILGDRLARSFHPKRSSGFANGPLLYKELKRIDGFPLNETVSRG